MGGKQMKYYDYLTEFIFVEDEPQKSDVIFIPGSRYGELAVKAAELYKQGMAELIIPSGKYSILTGKFEGALTPIEYRKKEYPTEAKMMEGILTDHGVPKGAIYAEEEALFTYENAIYSRKYLEEKGIYKEGIPFQAILVCQAYHARRSLLYYQLVFPEVRFLVCPVETKEITKKNWYLDPKKIDVVLGEVERCGSQFHEIMKGTDQVLEKCLSKKSEEMEKQND